jgi:hypothetical protein
MIEFAIVKSEPPVTLPKIVNFIQNNFSEEVQNRPNLKLSIKAILTQEKDHFLKRNLTTTEKQTEKEKNPELYTTSRGTLRAPTYHFIVNPNHCFG